ncbi:hypothetical protein BC936DRAFT_139158 [Jimgerdemannia flammicorona]|uniref:Uncharacterized protein n=1 Tax=Jimgerdemannia flammicorona TaxID=994334 RepID=A0A433BAI6_9FUNG|nr:hypothetical protein BC936DRAFT_139158 [Jimgerdemannia flammicorona]
MSRMWWELVKTKSEGKLLPFWMVTEYCSVKLSGKVQIYFGEDEFHTAVRMNVTSTYTAEALKDYGTNQTLINELNNEV